MALCYSGNARRHRTVTGSTLWHFCADFGAVVLARSAGQTLIWRGL